MHVFKLVAMLKPQVLPSLRGLKLIKLYQKTCFSHFFHFSPFLTSQNVCLKNRPDCFDVFLESKSECEAGVKRETRCAHSPHRACVALTHVSHLPSIAWETQKNKQEVTHDCTIKHSTLLLDHVDQVIYNNECSSPSYSSTERIKDSFNSVPENKNKISLTSNFLDQNNPKSKY